MERSRFLSENISQLGFEDTLFKVRESAAKYGWKIPAIHDLQETLRKSEIEVLPVTVLELCKPEYSGALMREDKYRFISPLMPCRIAIYQKSDGLTYISRLNTSLMTPFMGGKFGEVMGKAGDEIETIIQPIIVPLAAPDF